MDKTFLLTMLRLIKFQIVLSSPSGENYESRVENVNRYAANKQKIKENL